MGANALAIELSCYTTIPSLLFIFVTAPPQLTEAHQGEDNQHINGEHRTGFIYSTIIFYEE